MEGLIFIRLFTYVFRFASSSVIGLSKVCLGPYVAFLHLKNMENFIVCHVYTYFSK